MMIWVVTVVALALLATSNTWWQVVVGISRAVGVYQARMMMLWLALLLLLLQVLV